MDSARQALLSYHVKQEFILFSSSYFREILDEKDSEALDRI